MYMIRQMIKKIELPSIRDSVYIQMREMILEGKWLPGSRIDLNELSREFGVSKTPLNETIQMLIYDGLLVVKPRSGTFVSSLDIAEILDNFDFRLMLEKGASEAILSNVTPPILRGLEHLNERMTDIVNSATTPEEYRRLLEIDNEFHQKIMYLSGNSQLAECYERLSARLMLMRMVNAFSSKDYKSTLVDHQGILAALRSGDPIAFNQASATHVSNAKVKIRRSLGSSATK